ncbi:PLDc N-terminal domain-containing protein [Staphylococcus aureus]|uniref:PLDc N-terminal domain-containing protein n=1 Tax=Staphylococcus aureus TaxID=1280 RepID=UPI003D68AC91
MIFKLLHDTINKIYYSFKIFDGRFQMIELLSIALKHSNIILNSIFIGAFILNLLFAFTIIFMERRSANSIWAWLLVLVFLPLFGFILYLLLGHQIFLGRLCIFLNRCLLLKMLRYYITTFESFL